MPAKSATTEADWATTSRRLFRLIDFPLRVQVMIWVGLWTVSHNFGAVPQSQYDVSQIDTEFHLVGAGRGDFEPCYPWRAIAR